VELDDARGRVDDHAQGVVDADALWRRLATLGRKQRAVLVPRYYEQLEDEQIADLLVELLLDRCLAAEPFPLPPADPAVAVDALLSAAAGMVSKQDRTGRGTRPRPRERVCRDGDAPMRIAEETGFAGVVAVDRGDTTGQRLTEDMPVGS